MINDLGTTSSIQDKDDLFAERSCQFGERSQLRLSAQPSRSYASVHYPQPGTASQLAAHARGFGGASNDGRQHGSFHLSQQEKTIYEESSTTQLCPAPLPLWVRRVIPLAVLGVMLLSYSTITIWFLLTRLWSVRASSTWNVHKPSTNTIVERSWAMYAPYYPVQPYEPPPSDCEITQVSRNTHIFASTFS